MPHSLDVALGDHTLTFETGRLAPQAHGAVVVRDRRSFVLGTVLASPTPRGADFLPLTVEYREPIAAGGRIPGSYFRREGKATDHEVLVSRLIDRSLRPLFPDGWRCETQVQVTVFSADPASDLETLGMLAAFAAVHLSDVPFDGPVAGARLVRLDGAWQWALGQAARRGAELDLVVSTSPQGLVMVEGRAQAVPEATLVEAFETAHAGLAPVLQALDALRQAAGKPKRPFDPPVLEAALRDLVAAAYADQIEQALEIGDKTLRRAALQDVEDLAVAELARPETDGRGEVPESTVRSAYEALLHTTLRRKVVQGWRIGDRRHHEVRPIECEVGLLGMTHGSAFFQRGETQALVTCTLGVEDEAQELETAQGKQSERFLLHYNFPPYSVGEVRPLRGPGRREVGHGNLARRALAAVLPDEASFPYTIRVVSDVLASNGSSSMATVCGGCLALMDAGVPIAAPVAGIAMGLVLEGDQIAILSDILGDEDHLGDMDFKVAGTAEGVTAVQLDNKLGSLPREVLARALEQARAGRLVILEAMTQALVAAREHISTRAPQLGRTRIDPERAGAVIGPAGRIITELQEQTGTRIKVRRDGTVDLVGETADGVRRAIARIAELTEAPPAPKVDLQQGAVYVGQVTGIKEYGAFVRIGDHEALVHVSELALTGGATPAQALSVGDEVIVRVVGVDHRGRLQLSQKAAAGVAKGEAIDLRGA